MQDISYLHYDWESLASVAINRIVILRYFVFWPRNNSVVTFPRPRAHKQNPRDSQPTINQQRQ